jgi:tetratricopeptide (TPR) repeat protein
MTSRRLRVDRALQVLPELDDLVRLRGALLGVSEPDHELARIGAGAYATADTRTLDADDLDAQVERIVAEVRSRTEQVLRHSVAALRSAQSGHWAEAARALMAAGEVEEGARRLEQAERFYRKALELGRKPRDRSAEGLAWRRLGRVLRLLGRLEEATKHYRRGFDVADAQRDVEGMIIACQGLGNVAVDQGSWDEAERWYTRGLELAPADPPTQRHFELYNNLAVTTLRSGRLEACERWLDRATEAGRVMEQHTALVALDNSRGRLLMARGLLAPAEKVFRDALRKEPGPFTRGRLVVNLAESLVAQGRLGEAQAMAREAELAAIDHGSALLLADAYRLLGAIARESADPDGIIFYEQALDVCREYQLPDLELAITHVEYAAMESVLGHRESAEARLSDALQTLRRIGSAPEVRRAETELARIQHASPESPAKDT